MKHAALLALITLAGSASAGISFQEQIILANIGSTPTIPSVGLRGNPANAFFSRAIDGRWTPIPNGSSQPYNLRTIEFVGSLSAINGGSYAREAVIRVQPPGGGQAFYIQPFLQAGVAATSLPIFTAHAVVPVSAAGGFGNPVGFWDFTFEETFDDISGAGADAIWQTAIVRFSEVPTNPPAADPNGGPASSINSISSSGTSTAPGAPLSFGLTNQEGPFNAFRITGQVTATTNVTTNAIDPQTSDVRVRIAPPTGGPITIAPVVTGVNALSTATVDVTVPYSGTQSGTWVLEFFELNDAPGGVDNFWNNFTLQLVTVPPPASADSLGDFIGISPSTPERFTGVFTAGAANLQVRWYTFTTTVDISQASGYYLDLDTVETVLNNAVVDTELALFDDRGTLIAEDDDSGPGNWSQLTFGSNVARPTVGVVPPATTAAAPRNGINGNLPLGIYYVASADFNASFASPYGVAGPTLSPSAGRFLNFRTNLSEGSFCGIADVGGQGGSEGLDNFLDNNDFIVFINLFFGQDPRADLGTEGGAEGSDGFFDNNDFIVFINAFFSGGSNPGCNEPG
jgi:hypothetical protein